MNEIKANWWATGVFAVTAIGSLGISFLRGPAAVVDAVMFFAGAALMGAALVIAAGRSRTETVEIGGVFFLQSPNALRIGFGAQLVIGFATAAARPYSSSAFGVLAPIFGLGMMGLWGARHAVFPARET